MQTHGQEIPPLLADRPEDPTRLMYLWEIFWEMSRGRQYAPMGGVMPLSSQQVHYWQAVKRFRLSDAEIALLFKVDDLYLKTHAKKEPT